MMKKIPIIFEDKDVLVLNKPSGLVVHADGKTKEATVADWVLKNYPKMKEVGEPTVLANGDKILRPGIVHRIDRETSGILLLAKNQKAFEYLKKQFQDRTIEKTYLAFVSGELKNKKGVIDKPIGRSSTDFRRWTSGKGARGTLRDAVTAYTTLETGKGYSYVEVKPKTGRTHQIRVHFKFVQHPILGDALYAPKLGYALGFSRLALHAYQIKFTLPSGKEMSLEAPIPKDFLEAKKLMLK
ncbi:MAG: RluA family pseudouridine synthase [Candidatus Pacebacteria bacterium]|nr:RluA family pseudouridine synthase [Candidatus Paceibacterota bacterium]MDD5356886.1 RluA family pseudouridine synthase [Candidatus Paceibacterota bacterium]